MSRARATQSAMVTPRIGTVSPWSSKATDIAHVCGLTAITRIERGTEWTLIGEQIDVAKVGAVLSDRMTESVILREQDLAKVVAPAGSPRRAPPSTTPRRFSSSPPRLRCVTRCGRRRRACAS